MVRWLPCSNRYNYDADIQRLLLIQDLKSSSQILDVRLLAAQLEFECDIFYGYSTDSFENPQFFPLLHFVIHLTLMPLKVSEINNPTHIYLFFYIQKCSTKHRKAKKLPIFA